MRKLTEKEVKDLIYNIGKPSYHFINRKIIKELRKIEYGKDKIDPTEIVSTIITTLSNVDNNILSWLKKFYNANSMNPCDEIGLYMAYFFCLCEGLSEKERKLLKEKMN